MMLELEKRDSRNDITFISHLYFVFL